MIQKTKYSIYIDGGYNNNYAIPYYISNAIKGKRNILVLCTNLDREYARKCVTEYNKGSFSSWFSDGIKFHACPDNKIIFKK